jgi:hypothetical protein
MVDLAGVVRNASFDISSPEVSLPTPLMVVFSVFNRIHRVWRWYRRAKVYSNPNNFLALAGGHALNFVAGERLLVRISALSVLIAQRIMLVVDQIRESQESYRKLKSCFNDEYSKVIEYKSVGGSFISPSTATELKYRMHRMIEKTKKIFLCFIRLFKECFVLSMRMIDAIEMFYLSPETRNEGINEIFVNGTQLLDRLEENRQVLQDSIKNSKPLIEKILKGIGSKFTADQFVTFSTEAVENIAQAHKATKEVTNLFGKIVTEIAKRTLFGLASLLGLHQLVPKALYPDYSVKPREVELPFRFVPESDIKIKC